MQQDRQSEGSACGPYKSVVTFFEGNKKAGAVPSNIKLNDRTLH